MNSPRENDESSKESPDQSQLRLRRLRFGTDWGGLARALLGCFLWLIPLHFFLAMNFNREGALNGLGLNRLFVEALIVVFGVPATISAIVGFVRSQYSIDCGNIRSGVLIRVLSLIALAIGSFVTLTMMYLELKANWIWLGLPFAD